MLVVIVFEILFETSLMAAVGYAEVEVAVFAIVNLVVKGQISFRIV